MVKGTPWSDVVPRAFVTRGYPVERTNFTCPFRVRSIVRNTRSVIEWDTEGNLVGNTQVKPDNAITMRHAHSLFLSCITMGLQAQQCEWLTSAPIDYEMNPSMASEVLASAPGRLVTGRNTTGDYVYGQTIYGNAVIESLDSDGLPDWSCGLHDSASVESAVVSADGRAFFAGRFMGTLQLCNGEVVGGVPGQGSFNENLFLLAVDLNDGTIEWTRNVSLAHEQGQGIPSLALDPQGRLWYSVAEWGVGKAVRVDESGSDVETRIVDGVRVMGTISFDPWGGLYMSGSCDNFGFAFGGQSFADPGTSGYSMFVLRYKPDGSAGFAEFAEDITFQDPKVVATTDGFAYVAGNIFDSTRWGDIELHGPNWSSEVFLARLDSMGQFLWAIESSSEPGSPITGAMTRSKGPCIALDAEDRLYLIGDSRGTTDWGNGITSGGGQPTDHRLSVVAFEEDGSAVWSADSGVSPGFNEARTVAASAAPGSVYFAAHARDPFSFGAHTTNEEDVQAAVFGELSGISTGIRPVMRDRGDEVWPVPSRAVVHVRYKGRTTTAVLITSSGEQVRTLRLVPGRNSIDLSYLPTGLYFLRTAEGEVMRVVKE